MGLSVRRGLSGGTEAVVAEVTTADGRDAVLKVAFPGRDPTASELHTLLAARGRGYAEVLRHDRRGRVGDRHPTLTAAPTFDRELAGGAL